MSSIDIIVMSLRNLFKRKVRTFLTILGVVIGTAAIIVMISLGIAVNKNFEDSLSSMGDIRILTVHNPNGGDRNNYAISTSGSSSSRGQNKISLDEKALDSFKKLPNVVAATPTMEIYLQSVSGRYVTSLNIKGIDPNAMEAFEYKIDKGELLRSDEKYSAVFGATAASNFRDPKDRNWWMKDNTKPVVNIMEDKIEVSYDWSFGYTESNPFYAESEPAKQKPKPIKLNVKGVLMSMNWDTDYYVFMNIKDVQKLKADQAKYEQSQSSGGYSGGQKKVNINEFDNILVKVNDVKNVQTVKKQIEGMGYYADSYFIDMLNQMNEMSRSLQLFLGAIGAVSLFVAAIGITNTMIMSIYERTREIGIMKVIGASIKDIKKLFLLEAALIGFIGGLIGLGLSYLISFLLNNTGMSFLSGLTGGGMGSGSAVSVIPLWLSLAALTFSCVIGLVSGYFPAKRAMNLSALAAIRTE